MSIAVVARKTLIPVSRTSLVTLLRVTLNAYRWPWLSILTSTVSSSTRLHYITYKIYKARYTKSSRSDSKMLTVKVRIHFTAGCQPAGRNVVNIHSIKRATCIVYCPHSRLAATQWRHKRPGWTVQAPPGSAHLHSSSNRLYDCKV